MYKMLLHFIVFPTEIEQQIYTIILWKPILLSIGQSSWGELKKRVGEGVGKTEKEVKTVKEDKWRGEGPRLKIQPRKKDHKKET